MSSFFVIATYVLPHIYPKATKVLSLFKTALIRFDLKKLTMVQRLEQWEIGSRMLRENPLTGIGLGNYLQKAGLNLDLHNTPFKFLVEFGLLSSLTIFIAAWVLFRALKRFKKAKGRMATAGVVALIFFLALPHFVDAYFAYRSLTLIVAVWFFGVVLAGHKDENDTNQNSRLWSATFTFGIVCGALTFFSPHTRPVIGASYENENYALRGNFHWQSIYAIYPFPGNGCWTAEIVPAKENGLTQLTVRIVNKDYIPPRHANWKQYVQTRAIAPPMSQNAILENIWSTLCVCSRQPSGNSTFIYIQVEPGRYFSLGKQPIKMDGRLASFGITDPRFYTLDKMGPSNKNCRYSFDF
jgi:hypothetical protein